MTTRIADVNPVADAALDLADRVRVYDAATWAPFAA